MQEGIRTVCRRIQFRAREFTAFETKCDILFINTGVGFTPAAEDRSESIDIPASFTRQFFFWDVPRHQILEQLSVVSAEKQFTCLTVDPTRSDCTKSSGFTHRNPLLFITMNNPLRRFETLFQPASPTSNAHQFKPAGSKTASKSGAYF